MRLTLVTLSAAVALASTPALAQLAGSGNLVGTQGKQPAWPGISGHQSTTMVNAGGGNRGVITGVNGGDLAPGVQNDQLIVVPKQVRDNTQNRSAGGWVEVGQQTGGVNKGITLRSDVANNLGSGPKDTYRSADVNTPRGAGNLGAGNLGGAGGANGGKAVTGLLGGAAGNLTK